MKLNLNTDFSSLPRAGGFARSAEAAAIVPYDVVVLAHDERHLRRKVLQTVHDEKFLVDLIEPVSLAHGDRLVLEDGRHLEVIASEEEVYDIRARDAVHLAELAWHIGNRHLAAAIEAGRILILRDHVIKAMLEGLGATVAETTEPFDPLRGAYSGHGHHGHAQLDAYGREPGDPHFGHNHPVGHDHAHSGHHPHEHDGGGHHHARGERDKFGRLPGDPHYGHNHA